MAASPAAPLTFHLQEKLPSGRHRGSPRLGERRTVRRLPGTRRRPAPASGGREPRPDPLSRRVPYSFSCSHGTDGITPSAFTTNGARVAATFRPVSFEKLHVTAWGPHCTGHGQASSSSFVKNSASNSCRYRFMNYKCCQVVS
uniref:Uncharacterized protein n=1 Tax=Rousettus aegyptiacus TaxID=9407 RepID=A0A7J8JGU9_ROUAE|nr:hypothetical protein HJG63_010315 [Rousettus aegyptiacus]